MRPEFVPGQVVHYDGADDATDYSASYVRIVEDVSNAYTAKEAPYGMWEVEFPLVLDAIGGPLTQEIQAQYLHPL